LRLFPQWAGKSLKKRGFVILLLLTAASALSLFLNREAEAQCRYSAMTSGYASSPHRIASWIGHPDGRMRGCAAGGDTGTPIRGATVHSCEHEGVTVLLNSREEFLNSVSAFGKIAG